MGKRKPKPKPSRPTNNWQYLDAMQRPDGQLWPIVRMKHPQAPGLYYRHGDDVTPWVSTGYTTWAIAEWRERFGPQEPDNRVWDFFGEPIELWPPGSEEEDQGGK